MHIRTNAWGLRGPEVPPPVPGQRRILFLGSSVTLGWGVAPYALITCSSLFFKWSKAQPGAIRESDSGWR